jgi:hypothetical protein
MPHAVGPQLDQRPLPSDLVEPGPQLRRRRTVGRRDGQLAARGEVAAEHVMDRLQLREQRIIRRLGSLHDARIPPSGLRRCWTGVRHDHAVVRRAARRGTPEEPDRGRYAAGHEQGRRPTSHARGSVRRSADRTPGYPPARPTEGAADRRGTPGRGPADAKSASEGPSVGRHHDQPLWTSQHRQQGLPACSRALGKGASLQVATAESPLCTVRQIEQGCRPRQRRPPRTAPRYAYKIKVGGRVAGRTATVDRW